MKFFGKKNLLIVTGAGASVEFGLPSVAQIDDLLSIISAKYATVPSACSISLYSWLQRFLQEHSSRLLNYEDVLYYANVLGTIIENENPLGGFFDRVSLPEIDNHIYSRRHRLNGEIIRMVLLALHDGLVDEFRERCRNIHNSMDLEKTKQLFRALERNFNVCIINMNYDNILALSCPGYFNGFDASDGTFDLRTVMQGCEKKVHYQIHGSVHYDMRHGNLTLHDIYWNPSLKNIFSQNSAGRNTINLREGLALPNSVFIAGYGKPHQIIRNPFRAFYSVLDRHVAESDACLLVGYGFNDKHINGAFEKYNDGPRNRPVLIVTYSDDMTGPMKFRRGDWVTSLRNTFPVRAASFRSSGGKYSYFVRDLRPAALEYSTDKPVAIWHHGFLSACVNSKSILKFLSTGDAAEHN